MTTYARLPPAAVLEAYRQGWFPMAQSRVDRKVYWINPDVRGVLPLTQFHVPRRLARTLRKRPFELTVNLAFGAVISACARCDAGRDREETWINSAIRSVFLDFHENGHAHSVECWRDGCLAGGLYGLAINGAFFGESMFSAVRDASKVALVHLVDRLRTGGFTLLDAQFENDHLDQFGQERMPRGRFRAHLRTALLQDADFFRIGPPGVIAEAIYPGMVCEVPRPPSVASRPPGNAAPRAVL